MFFLNKWYLDLVTDEATTLIVYAATLECGALRVRCASTLLARPDAATVERTAWSHVHMPEIDDGTLRLHHEGLQLDGEWRRAAAPIDITLLESVDGRLDWRCFAPNAVATVALCGECFTGRGYAECLAMTCPPWTLPLRRLRWGRYTSSSHSAVWIDWMNGSSRRWIRFDGVEQTSAVLEERRISGLQDAWEIRMAPVRTVTDRRALRAIARQLPALDALHVGPLRNLRETKWLARGTLWRGSEMADEGWIIHELATW